MDRRGLDARVLHVAVIDDHAGREIDVDAGQVIKLERAHAEVAAIAHDGIDLGRRRDVFVHDAQRL